MIGAGGTEDEMKFSGDLLVGIVGASLVLEPEIRRPYIDDQRELLFRSPESHIGEVIEERLAHEENLESFFEKSKTFCCTTEAALLPRRRGNCEI